MSYLKDREIWLSNVPTSNPPAGYVWVFIQNGVFVVRDSNGLDKIMATTTGTVTNATSASYVEYSNVASKPALISGSSQVSYTGLSNIPVGIVSGSSQVTYSGLTGIPSGIVSGSAQVASFGIFATTGSNGFNGSQSITGSLTVTGQVVAQTLNVQQVTSSIVYSSGSNIFGNSLSNTQQFTGSVSVTGSFAVTTTGTELQVTSTGVNLGNISTDNHNVTGSLRVSGSLAVTGSGTFSGNVTLSGTNSQLLQTISNSIAGDNAAVFYNSNANSYGLYIGAGSGTNHALYITDTTRTKDLFKVQGNGNVGIGTASPGSILQANFSNATTYSNGVTGSGLTLYNTSSINNQYVGLYFLGEPSSGNAGQATIYGITTGTGAMDLAFSTRGSSVLAERMRITSDGNVGIGTASPGNYILAVDRNAASLAVMSIRNLNSTGYSGVHILNDSGSLMGHLGYANASTGAALQDVVFFGSIASKPVVFTTVDTERMRITSAGNFDYGGFNVQSSNNATYRQAFYGGLSIMWRNGSDAYINTNHTYSSSNTNVATYGTDSGIGRLSLVGGEFNWATFNGSVTAGSAYALTDRFLINKAGNVGIGTSTINASSGYKMLRINGATTGAEIELAGNEVSYGYMYASSGVFVIDALASQPMRFRTGAQNRMEISSAGKVEIGNALVSGEILKVIGPTGTDNYISAYSGTIHMFLDADATNSSGIVGTQSSHNLILRTNGTNRMTVDTSGNIGAPTGTNIYNASDSRLKQNVETISNGLDKISTLNPVKFNWIDGFVPSEDGKDMLGFVAQEVYDIIPEAVESFGGNSIIVNDIEIENPLRVNEKFIIPVLVKAIQEQQTLIESLKSRIEILEQ